MSETVGLQQGLTAELGPGYLIGGKYRLEQEIGRGSMGTVFSALHVTLDQRVAIKLIAAQHSQSAEARRRFSVEAKAAAKLRSRHVVQVYDDGETAEGNPYIVLELLEGETLEQRLQREGDLSLVDSTRVVSHVGRALARAHAQGIVHRDLKPANIFLARTDDDETAFIAKVLDFGIAKLDGAGENGTTQTGTVLGTPLFMSPEQVRGASSVDYRADLYSLGMCLYHMLTGEFAFYSPNYSDTLIRICSEPLPRLRAKAPWVPEAVEAWFQRACAKDPLERFRSADEMSEALQAAAGAGAELSKHKSFPEGRIAPETLVGFASPPVPAPPAHAPGRTLQLAHVVPGAATAPGYGGVAGESAAGPFAPSVPSRQDRRGQSADFVLPTSSWRPLLIGVGLGLLALVTIVLTVVLLRERAPETGTEARPAIHVPPRAVPTVALQAEPLASPVVSSTAAATEPSAVATDSPRPPAPKRPVPAGRPVKPPKASGADLGF